MMFCILESESHFCWEIDLLSNIWKMAKHRAIATLSLK